ATMLHAVESGPAAAAPAKQGAEQWTKYDWNANSGKEGKAGFAMEQGKDGYLLHITSLAPDDARFVREMVVEPDTVYHFSCRVRTENVGVSARGANISVTGILEGSRDIKGSGGWQSIEFYGKTGANQRKISVTLGVGGYGSLNSGSAWFEGVKVEKMVSAPPGIKVSFLEPLPVGAAPSAGEKGWGGKAIAVFAGVGFLLLAGGFYLRRRKSDRGNGNTGKGSTGGGSTMEDERIDHLAAGPAQRAIRKSDIAIMAALTVVCLAVSLFNLGGHSSPETGWQPAAAGESVTIELGKTADLSRIYYFCGINERYGDGGKFTLSARNQDGSFVPFLSFTKDDVENWKLADVAVKTSAVRLTADTPNSRLNEIAFLEKGSLAPIKGLAIGGKKVSANDVGKPENLIDEQGTFEYSPSFRTGFYFDEIYHARSAWEMLHHIEPFETTHPPLGKMIISAGIALFGMNAFGWRIAGALFGVALVPLMYLLGQKLFRNRFFAFAAAFLMMTDFMRFAQSRVAVIDVYGVFFILLMYYYILDLFPGKGERAPRSVNMTLLLAGIAFGIGAACKWIAVYAGGGILLLVALRTASDLKVRAYPQALSTAGFLLRRTGVCLVSFVLIPVAVYILAYIPYMALPGVGHDLAGV
ncbi:MAG TPA: phospholipid carrier-dependent glycosyltransferase, partial [Geobacteraceae bacterium]